WPQTRDRQIVMFAADRPFLIRQYKRSPCLCPIRAAKLGPHHTDDGVVRTVEIDGVPYDVGIGAEAASPKLVAKHDDIAGPWLIFFRKKTVLCRTIKPPESEFYYMVEPARPK